MKEWPIKLKFTVSLPRSTVVDAFLNSLTDEEDAGPYVDDADLKEYLYETLLSNIEYDGGRFRKGSNDDTWRSCEAETVW